MHSIGRLADFVAVAYRLRGGQLLPRAFQCAPILLDSLLLKRQLLMEQRELRRQPRSGFIEILDASRSQPESALGVFHLFANAGDSLFAADDGLPGGVPLCLGKGKLPVAFVDLAGRFPHSRFRAVELSLRGGEGVGGILRGFLQRDVLPLQFAYLHALVAVLNLDCVQICLCRNGRGVGFTERGLVVLVRRSGVRDFLLQLCLTGLRVRQTLVIVVLTVVTLLKFAARLCERALVLYDRILLQGELTLQCGQLRRQPSSGGLEVIHTRACQLECRLRFLYLLLDGFDVAGEVIAVQRQRYHQIAERFAQSFSPAF